jgi:hypothetical protein
MAALLMAVFFRGMTREETAALLDAMVASGRRLDLTHLGIPVVISTRVPNGRVLPVYGFKGGGKTLQEAGAVMADNLPPQKARILLMLASLTSMLTPTLIFVKEIGPSFGLFRSPTLSVEP